jgi:DNA polymerase-3 subunit delta'
MNLFGDDIVEDDFEGDVITYNDAPTTKADTLQPPQLSNICVGHEDQEKEFLSLWNAHRMPHSVILNGLKGIGKATFAYRLARFILKESGGGDAGGLFGDEAAPETLAIPSDHPVFSRVASGGHSDIMVITRPFDEKKGQFKNEIPVDDIRKVAPFLRKTSGDGGWRVVIVDDANTMNRNGQNALLKILEEPPQNALLILVTHGAGGLLPTIRSRCRFISFSPLGESDLHALLNKSSDTLLSHDDVALLSRIAEGSAGQAIELYQNGGLDHVRKILDALNDIKTLSNDTMDQLALAYGRSGDQATTNHFIFILNWWFEILIYMHVHDMQRQTIGDITLTAPLNQSLHSLIRKHEDVMEHMNTCLNSNLDKRYMIYKALRMVRG